MLGRLLLTVTGLLIAAGLTIFFLLNKGTALPATNEQKNMSIVLTDAAHLNKPGFPVFYRGVVLSTNQKPIISLHPITKDKKVVTETIFTVNLSACATSDKLGLPVENDEEIIENTPENLQMFIEAVVHGGEMLFACDSGDFSLSTLSCDKFTLCSAYTICADCL